MIYNAPVKDIRFALNALADLPAICALPGNEDCTVELVDAILEEAAKFAEGVLAPTNRAGDAGAKWSPDFSVRSPEGFKEAWQQYVEAGWAGLRAPAEFGGQGLPALVSTAAEEMWCSANLAFSLAPLLTLGAVEAIHHHASEALKAIYLPRMSTGEWTGTMNLTEPQAGSDLAQVRSRAVPAEDGSYRITGQKIFITWGEHDLADNIVHLVLARLPDAPAGVKGISLFIVPKFLVNADGSLGARNDVRCVSLEHKLGIHGSPTAVMSFGDEGGAVGYLVGEPNKGLNYMFTMMNHARLGVGIEGMAVSERAYQKAVEYARERVQSRAVGSPEATGVAIIQHPDIRRMLMTMKAQIEAQRALALYTAAALDRAARHPLPEEKARNQALVNFLIPIVKGWNTEQANEITSMAVQVHGGMGYVEETGVAQYYRDARITAIYEGTTGIQALDLIGRKTASENGVTARALLAEARATADRLAAAGEASLSANLSGAVVEAERCVAFILESFASNPRLAAAGSVPFLKLMGIVLGGWQMGRAGLAALSQQGQEDADADFLNAKLITARFYGEHLLPQVSGLAAAIVEGAESALALPESAF
ncbi:Acyl-CoA dehydrogenase related to the alkylation response protein AidB [Gulbenkiania indica]|uniref:3-methylmercaptopropionyl-CoA dehydrogenase n=2 Tax=Gulbenkiania TaxID=397456 RepID=A0A0K6GSF5_9NEIS|nr:acyl-CoA dehydrogenase [Gulbenkiania indica]TCW32413.1 acyl-CoA dehydrogenase [Gulbenkiania mobilis]CUA81674.1 Acyl-CoA dehydrogenase related to the alkylation response protein AidB [Gulbenkiania indica]